MPTLNKSKHELFAQQIASGVDCTSAYAAAGYAPSPQNAARLRDRADVQARVAELVSDAAEATGITIDRVLHELACIAFASADDYFAWDEGGVSVKASDMLTRDQMAAICQVEETKLRGERTIRVRMADKQRALELLGKHVGLFQPAPVAPQEHMHFHIQSPGELIADRLALLAKRTMTPTIEHAQVESIYARHDRDMAE